MSLGRVIFFWTQKNVCVSKKIWLKRLGHNKIEQKQGFNFVMTKQ